MFGSSRNTRVAIDGEKFTINGDYTYTDRWYDGHEIEGLLFNSRMIQALFDDENPETVDRWTYPDTGEWDPERNVEEFIEAMPQWYEKGLRAVTINLQCGSPEGYSDEQPWLVSAFEPDGSLKEDWMDRLRRVLERADEVGLVVILGYFYFGQDDVLKDEAAVINAVENATNWLLEREYTNVLVEINNECNIHYNHDILKPGRVHELINLVKTTEQDGYRYPVSTSFSGGKIASDDVIATADFILLHGNGVDDSEGIEKMIQGTHDHYVGVRDKSLYEPMPIVFNEDDHFGFPDEPNNMYTAFTNYASWGYFDPGENNYRDGYQCPPVNWGINTSRKQRFFDYLEHVVHGED